MSGPCVTWKPGMASLGRAVVAIGVFDGVHRGHQDLLDATIAEARESGARSVAITFDRDPDQVVTPEAAAPQLLTLDDKCRFLGECGINIALVVPFTCNVATMPAEQFLDEVLGSVTDVLSIHVGEDFRFGARAAGDIDTLRTWGAANNADVYAHDLVEFDGAPITSTRIRSLVASGDVAGAAELLGRATRVSGTVHLGRQQGRQLGFPTANVVPVEFAALPADGVYAGYAELQSGARYQAAISVGTPPSFPEARDYLEAHLIGFDGDLYDRPITLSFVQRLRDLRGFDSLEELSAAIEADVAAAAQLERVDGFEPESFMSHDAEDDFFEDGTPVIDDIELLAAAEAAAASMNREPQPRDPDWVPVTENSRHVSSIYSEAGVNAALITGPLVGAGIPFAWDPYDPMDMPTFRYAYGAIDRRFTLYVPAEHVEEARMLLGVPRPTDRAIRYETARPSPFANTEWTPIRVVLGLLALAALLLFMRLVAL